MPHPVEVLRRGKSGRSRTNDCDLLVRPDPWFLSLYPAFLESLFDNCKFYVSYRHGFHSDIQSARFFAWSRTHPACYLRKIVGRVKKIRCLPPFSLVNKIVPVRNIIDYGTAVSVTKRYAAVLAS